MAQAGAGGMRDALEQPARSLVELAVSDLEAELVGDVVLARERGDEADPGGRVRGTGAGEEAAVQGAVVDEAAVVDDAARVGREERDRLRPAAAQELAVLDRKMDV